MKKTRENQKKNASLKDLNNQKAITLIALVVTIVVLLILAGVSLNLVIGENGIISKAKDTRTKSSHASVIDAMSLAYADYKVEINTTSNTTVSFWNYLLSKDYIDENGVVNVTKLVGSKQVLGNGTGSADVYKLEQENKKYILKYYEEQEKQDVLWEITDDSEQKQINWEEIFEDAKENPDNWKAPGQESDTIGIDENGKPVNMDDWGTMVVGSGQVTTGDGAIGCISDGRYSTPSYAGKDKVVTIPKYVKNVDWKNFYNVKHIGKATFVACDDITSVKVPSGLWSIGDYAFAWCSSLNNINSLNEVSTIGNKAFYECSSLSHIDISSELSRVGEYAFYKCSSLTTVNYAGTMQQWKSIYIEMR